MGTTFTMEFQNGDLTLDSWTSEGTVPTDLRAYFPTSHGETRSVTLHSVRVSTADRQ